MSTKTIEQFFTGKTLEIPPYQRDYAWTTSNIDDLFDDLQEAMELGGGHYLGTFILSQADKNAPFKVVDGQQRLTTLTLLLDALINATDDQEIKSHYRASYIRHPLHGQKFSVLGINREFFDNLMSGKNPDPDSDGQFRMKAAYEWIRDRVFALKRAQGENAIQQWLLSIGNLEVLEFTEANEGKAIRMFQSVNDRGVPLSRMDIAKSLLIYYSNHFLDAELDRYVSEKFGDAFRAYSRIKRLASESGYQVNLINRNNFREDDVFRYHYFAFNGDEHCSNAGFDYNATSETVLEGFLKPTLKMLRGNKDRLRAFILDYVSDLSDFFNQLLVLIEGTRSSKALYLVLVVGDLASTLYPLAIRLAQLNKLDEVVPSAANRSLLQLIELADLRVFKLRGTNPQADIAALIRKLDAFTAQEIGMALCNFTAKFMDDALFKQRLYSEALYRNPGLERILIAAEEDIRQQEGSALLGIDELAAIYGDGLTVEHILPQKPSFDIAGYGFDDSETYETNIHRIGNLTLLERGLNSACNNATVERKVDDQQLYRTSDFRITRNLAAEAPSKTPAFSKSDIDGRCEQLAELAVRAWPIRTPELLAENS